MFFFSGKKQSKCLFYLKTRSIYRYLFKVIAGNLNPSNSLFFKKTSSNVRFLPNEKKHLPMELLFSNVVAHVFSKKYKIVN